MKRGLSLLVSTFLGVAIAAGQEPLPESESPSTPAPETSASVAVETKPASTPSATPKPKPKASPHKTPAKPKATPTPTATPTVVPTPTPTPKPSLMNRMFHTLSGVPSSQPTPVAPPPPTIAPPSPPPPTPERPQPQMPPTPKSPAPKTQQLKVEPTAIPSPSVVATPLPEPSVEKRSWLGRMFSGSSAPQYKDPKVRGLVLELQVSPSTVKLSEVRQLDVKAKLVNQTKKAIELEFPSDQRIEIYLMNSAGAILTKWSENHLITDRPGSVLVNPKEHIEYNETIATRELVPDKVFIVEVFFPKYPDLRARQKFLTAP